MEKALASIDALLSKNLSRSYSAHRIDWQRLCSRPSAQLYTTLIARTGHFIYTGSLESGCWINETARKSGQTDQIALPDQLDPRSCTFF